MHEEDTEQKEGQQPRLHKAVDEQPPRQREPDWRFDQTFLIRCASEDDGITQEAVEGQNDEGQETARYFDNHPIVASSLPSFPFSLSSTTVPFGIIHF